jgi:hypothetical protein
MLTSSFVEFILVAVATITMLDLRVSKPPAEPKLRS